MDTKADQQRRRNILIVDDTVELAQTYKELLRRFVFVTGESGDQKIQPCLRAVEPPVFTRPVPTKNCSRGWNRFGRAAVKFRCSVRRPA
jgi:type II secretory pathway predicted ATPase ExeA